MEFRDPVECYESIGNALADAISQNWTRICVEAVLDGSSVDLLAEYERPDGSKEAIPYVPMLARYFHSLARLVSNEEKGLFRKCIFLLSADGEFKVDFEYEQP